MQSIKDEYVPAKKARLKQEVEAAGGAHMAIVQVGHVESSDRYVRNKIKDCEDSMVKCDLIALPEDVTQNELLAKVRELNENNSIDGFIVQLPLPKGIDEDAVKQAISPSKDVDGFNILSKTVPATPLGIFEYLKDQGFSFVGKNAVVIGRSGIVGRPMAKLLLDASCNVTVLHSKTSDADKRRYVAMADLIVVATGHRLTLDSTFELKPTAVIIDVGINQNPYTGKLCGDCEADLKVAFQSPVPGGVGLLTRLSVIENILALKKLKSA